MSIRWPAVPGSIALVLTVALSSVVPVATVSAASRISAPNAATPASGPAKTLADLPVAAQYAFSADTGKADSAYHFKQNGQVVVASAAGLTAEVGSGGVVYRNGESSWSISAAALNNQPLPSSATTMVDANRVDRPLGPVEESVIVGTLGIQQLWTVAERPANGLTLQLGSDSQVELNDTTNVTLINPSGARLPYGGLYVYDAVGQQLDARFEHAPDGLQVWVDDSAAQYPVVIDPFARIQRITNGPINLNQLFGSSVAVSDDGNTLAIGAVSVLVNGSDQTAVLVYNRTGSTWSQVAKLYSNTGVGGVTAISGDGSTIVSGIGSIGGNPVSVFVRPPGGWSGELNRTTRLEPNTFSGTFGESLAISQDGSTIAIGDTTGFGVAPTGVVNVYQRPGGAWPTTLFITETGRLFDDAPFGIQRFGSSVAISDDGLTIAVGAPEEPILTIGATFVYTRAGLSWPMTPTTQAKLTAFNSSLMPNLGAGVDISADGKTIVAGGCALNTSCNLAAVFVAPSGWTTSTETANLIITAGTLGIGRVAQISSDGSTILLGGRELTNIHEYTRPTGGWTGFIPSTSIINNGESNPISGYQRHPMALAGTGGVMALGLSSAEFGSGAAFIYVQPKVNSFAPTSGKPGDVITFTGSNLDAISTVAFGGVAANTVGPKAPATFTATVGAGATGDVIFGIGTVTTTLPGFTFIKGDTTTSIVSTAPTASAPGQPVAVSFNVASNGVTANGVVTVTATTGETCSASPAAGTCSLTFFSPGYRAITAVYSGTTAFNGSTSAPVDYTVKLPTSTSVTGVSQLNPDTNVPVAVTFTVQSTIGVPSGTVTVTADTGESCTGDVATGRCFIIFTTPGPHIIRATYAGNGAYLGSTSPNFDVTSGKYIYRSYSSVVPVNAPF